MPTTRRKLTRQQITIGTFEMLHLLQGCCLCGCQLCYGPDGIARTHGADAWTLRDFARDTWRQNRSALLQIWRTKPAGALTAGFRAAAYRGHGFWFPCFAEALFDGTTWPNKDKNWPAEARKVWDSINCYLQEVKNGTKKTS